MQMHTKQLEEHEINELAHDAQELLELETELHTVSDQLRLMQDDLLREAQIVADVQQMLREYTDDIGELADDMCDVSGNPYSRLRVLRTVLPDQAVNAANQQIMLAYMGLGAATAGVSMNVPDDALGYMHLTAVSMELNVCTQRLAEACKILADGAQEACKILADGAQQEHIIATHNAMEGKQACAK